MDKRFAYQVTNSTYPKVKVGEVLLYKQSRGPTHSEQIVNTKTFKHVGHFAMEQVGPCWVVNGKIQFEKPPARSGVYTEGIMKAVRKRQRSLTKKQKKI